MGSSNEQQQQPTATARRSLFPSSYSRKQARKNKNLSISFSPYARQKVIESNLSEADKAIFWYQKSDYDDFTKLSRVISKALLEGGSEVWLLSQSPTPATPAPDAQVATKHVLESSASGETPSKRDLEAVQTFHETRSEWWHKFGHSRRGLEHIASIGEGRQRHTNVRATIETVLEEQRRQEMFLPAGYYDVDKLRSVYIQQTHWARSLARAMGEADADEVRCNFDVAKRKPREFFLKAHLSKDAHDSDNLPSFMQTILTISSNKLNMDANTASQIRFRNRSNSTGSLPCHKKGDSPADLLKSREREPTVLQVEGLHVPDEKKCESDDRIPTPTSAEFHSKLAKKAAGWDGDDDEQDQLKILTGMGTTNPSGPATIMG
ncbi:MAG: hypothetical protein SGILL_000434 [Bacillariaceae sp.]